MDGLPDDLDLWVFDALPDLLIVVRDERVRWTNAAATRALGPALIDRTFSDLFAPGERRRLALLEEQRALGWDLPSTCRVRFVRPSDGQELTADVRLGEHGKFLVVSARDVSDVTRAENLMGNLAQTFARGATLLDVNGLLDATEPIFLALGWIVGFTEVVPDGSIARRVIAPEGDPVGQYGRSVIGVRLPLSRTPILVRVLETGRAIFFDNVPTLQPGAAVAAAPLSSTWNELT